MNDTRSLISAMAKFRLGESLEALSAQADLWCLEAYYPALTQHLVDAYGAARLCPQVLILRHGSCACQLSQGTIRPEAVLAALEALAGQG